MKNRLTNMLAVLVAAMACCCDATMTLRGPFPLTQANPKASGTVSFSVTDGRLTNGSGNKDRYAITVPAGKSVSVTVSVTGGSDSPNTDVGGLLFSDAKTFKNGKCAIVRKSLKMTYTDDVTIQLEAYAIPGTRSWSEHTGNKWFPIIWHKDYHKVFSSMRSYSVAVEFPDATPAPKPTPVPAPTPAPTPAPATYPDLSPSTPSGWSAPLVVSTSSSATSSSKTSFVHTDSLYVSWNVGCSGKAVSTKFYTRLYVDGSLRCSWYSDGASNGGRNYVIGYDLGSLSIGTHTLKIVTDADGNVAESNESNNTCSKTITVAEDPDCQMSFYVRFNAGGATGGSMSAVRKIIDVCSGESLTYELPACKYSRAGHDFAGWKVDDACSAGEDEKVYAAGYRWEMCGDLTLTAMWKESAPTHVMTLYRNNSAGDGAGARRTVTEGSYFTLPTISSLGWTRSGYTFKGWATSRGATSATYGDGARISVSSSLYSLYAVWQSNVSKHVMTLYRNNSAGDGAGARRTVTDNAYYTLPTISSLGWTRSGYTFKGWTPYRGSTYVFYVDGASIYASSGTDALYAIWEATAADKKYVVRLHRNNSAGDGATAGRTMVVGSSRELPTVYSLGWDRDGYVFEGWAYSPDATSSNVAYGDGESVCDLSLSDGAVVHLYAVWHRRATGARVLDGPEGW